MKSVSCKLKPLSTKIQRIVSILQRKNTLWIFQIKRDFCWKPKEILSVLLFLLLSLIGAHAWYQFVSPDCLKASDDQIASFLQSTTAWKQPMIKLIISNYINRSPNISAVNITNATDGQRNKPCVHGGLIILIATFHILTSSDAHICIKFPSQGPTRNICTVPFSLHWTE